MGLFFRDYLNAIQVRWNTLIDDLLISDYYNPYCYTSNYYEVFKHLILSILLDEEIILLDSDFSTEELVNLAGYSDLLKFNKVVYKDLFPKIKSKEELIQQLVKPKNNWTVTLFTSGTTGLPKKVSHNFESITRFVKISESNKQNIWGFAYNPTHIAGIQVFFQALLNGNPIIRLFGLTREEIFNEIENCSITHISATPTFYRLILPYENSFYSVIRVTSGGEKFDDTTIARVKHTFPNAKITNVYASTEAGTLFASDGDVFSIKSDMSHLVKIDENELLIHKDLLGTSSMNVEEWYRTGDLVEILSENQLTFRFLSRKTEMINVGGYKVNPHEVEEAIRNIEGIKDVRIFAKSNSVLGNVVCCEIVRSNSHLEEADIRAYLQLKLQEFKIPRMIRFVKELSISRTGKTKRL